MFYELARAAVQRIFQDKILMGLVIVMVLAILVGGFGGSGSEKAERGAPTGPREVEAAKPAHGPGLEPQLATDFIKWWLGTAMDFNAQTAQKSHSEAISWMTPETAQAFQANFWPPELAEGIGSGRVAASFTPSGVQAIAANPDGSIVVTVTGTLMMQAGPQPATHQFVADFLVRKEHDNLRVAGLYNRTVAASGGRVY